MGAVLSAWVAYSFSNLPAPLLISLMLIAAFIGGGLLGGICGFLKAKWSANEVVTTMMFNYVAILLVNHLSAYPWRRGGGIAYPMTSQLVPAAWMPVIAGTRIHYTIVIGIVAAIIIFLLAAEKPRQVTRSGRLVPTPRRPNIPGLVR